jgi:hypothetical protein
MNSKGVPMPDPRQQTLSSGPTDKEVQPTQHPTRSPAIASIPLAILCFSGFLVVLFLR